MMPMMTQASIRFPAHSIDASSASRPGGVRNQIKLIEKNEISDARSKTRSTKIVTTAALGLTRRSRIGSHIGRTISPALPTKNTAEKPTVVVAKSSLKLAGVMGARSTCHRTARKKYPRQIPINASDNQSGFAFRKLALTSCQSRFRAKNHRRKTAKSESKMNFKYFRKPLVPARSTGSFFTNSKDTLF